MVRAQRDGRLVGGGCRAGGDPQALPRSRSVARTQASAVQPFGRRLARSVQYQLRCVALRSDQHLLRSRSTVPRRRQASARLFAGPPRRLRAGDHCAGGHARRAAARLRGAAGQHGRQHDPQALSRPHRGAIRQGAPHLADGPGRTDRSGADRDARRRAAGAISGRHAKGAPDPAGKGACRQTLAGRPAGCAKPAPAKAGVKLLPQDGELYVFAQSADRVAKERSMRRRQLKWLWGRLKQLANMKLSREELLMRLGAARKQARTAWRLLAIEVAADSAALSYRLDRAKLRRARRREGRYLLRTNLTDDDPARLWGLYLQLVGVEEAFRNLKSLPPRRRGATLPSARSFTRTRRASRRISSSPSSPTACTSPSAGACTPWRPA